MAVGTRPPGEPEVEPEVEAPVTETTAEVPTVVAGPLVEGTAPEVVPVSRLALIIGCPMLAAAIMTGGLFIGVGGRMWAAIAGLAGIGLAVWASTRARNQWMLYAGVLGGVFLIGLIAVVPTGFSNVFNIASEIKRALRTSDVLRPPVEFQPGWHAITAWVMAALGFAAAWIAIELKRPALGLIAVLPLICMGAISLPESQQAITGLICLILFVLGLGLLSGAQPGDEEERRAARQYEIRRAIRALPLIGIITLALYLVRSSSFLFPEPIYDPAQEARLPETQPLSEVTDRVLFTVDAKFTGPWKMGTLDVYDGKDWRLPPFSDSKQLEVPESGIVDEDLKPGVRADFTIRGLTGAILPGVPNTVGIVAEGPKLTYDDRAGNIRLAQGQFEQGFKYIVAAAGVPTVERLRRTDPSVPKDIKEEFIEKGLPDPPSAVEGLLRRAPTDNQWDRLDFIRTNFLRSVTAKGQGTPKSVPPERVQDLISGTKLGTPFEIVAAQALLARWAGVPSRIGYGFDGGDPGPSGILEVRPRHGAMFLEVYFQNFGWLPVIGDPLRAQEALSEAQQQFNPNVRISEEVGVKLFLPIVREDESRFFEDARDFVFRVAPILVALALLYYLWPLPYKAFRRARRRTWASERGPSARVALAYAEWRDLATDYGYRHYTDTPLMFLERVIPDEEHSELAWLVTRSLWGDLRHGVTEDDALNAEELSRSLRRRLSNAQPATLRLVGALSRLSIRQSYAPGLDVLARALGEERREIVEAQT